MHFTKIFSQALVLSAFALSTPIMTHSETPNYSFVVVGCNRLNDVDTAGIASTANLPALNRLFKEVAALDPAPSYLFFAGDMVLGYVKDTVELERQLKAWIEVYKASPLALKSTKLVAIPGNHETQDKKAGKLSFPGNERTWLRVMADYIIGTNGPTADSTHGDSLKTDQSRLTYSFEFNGDHFVMLDTDPVGRDWRVPNLWIAKNISDARSAGARHIFLIGHKPAYPGIKTATLDDGLAKYPANRDAFWSSLEASQCEAMFAAHVHVWDKIQPHAGKTWQIIAGNGGSQVESTWVEMSKPKSAYHGFTLVNVPSGGSVKVKSMGHDIIDDATYFLPSDSLPTTVRDSAEVTWGGSVAIQPANRSLGHAPRMRTMKSVNLNAGEMEVRLWDDAFGYDGKQKLFRTQSR